MKVKVMSNDSLRQFEHYLSREFNGHLSYAMFDGWRYDQRSVDEPFLKLLTRQLEQAPDLVERIKNPIYHATVYVCGNLAQTHLVKFGALAAFVGHRLDVTPGHCEAYRGDIYVAREYRSADLALRDNDGPAFIIAHEWVHILDSELGKVTDPYGEAPPIPSMIIDAYANECLTLDLKEGDRSLPIREGLLSGVDGQDGPRCNDASEIICDIIAHRLTGSEPAELLELEGRYPNLAVFSKVFTAMSTRKDIASYRTMADDGAPRSEIMARFCS
jgi:hypothetical protein